MVERSAHIDMEAEVRRQEKREKKLQDWRDGNGTINGKFRMAHEPEARLDAVQIHVGTEPTEWDTLGPAQVESVLAFCVDAETEREMENAEIEERVENRMIRRKNGIPD